MDILVACERSGIVRDAFRAKGHNAWSCDLSCAENVFNDKYHIQDDVLKHLDDGWDMMIAHPPCTYLSFAGNAWFLPKYKHKYPHREDDRQQAAKFFMKFVNANILRIAIENPVGIMNTIYKKPNQIISPNEFGHKEHKTTCLWLKNLPILQKTKYVEPEYITLSNGKRTPKFMATTWGDSVTRSKTFQGIADAMAEQWGKENLPIQSSFI